MSVRKDVFLSHARTDKDQYVRPFAAELDRRGISYWLDQAEIAWGDKITVKINEGLRESQFVIVFLSDAFVGRNWTEAELAAALNRENSEGRNVVLPVIIGEAKKLLEAYPLLRDKAYLHWDAGIVAIADQLQGLKDRKWTLGELNEFIRHRVNLDAFPKQEMWGPKYRLLAKTRFFDEGAYFFWDEEQCAVERYWIEAVRSSDPQEMTPEDIELVRSVVTQHPR